MRTRRQRVVAAAAAGALAGMGIVGAVGAALADNAKVDVSTLPKSMHGAVETKAFTFGTVLPPTVPSVGSVLLDPGPAYAYSTLDRDDYGGGNVNYTMTARGANMDPGTIGAAASWAPANCDDPNAQLPCALRNPTDPITNPKRKAGTPPAPGDIDMNTAAGWPAYAEALFPPLPPPAPDRTAAYKCVVNKDSNGAQPTTGQAQTICQQGGDSVPLTAWAQTNGDQVRSEGFSRAEGFSSPGMFSVGPSESHSVVKPVPGGALDSTGYSTINSIDIGGQIHIDQVRSEGDIAATADKVLNATGSCTLHGFSIGGKPVQQSTGGEVPAGQLQPLLDGVEKATQLRVEIIPPTGVENSTVEGAKHVVGCTGLRISITDERTQSPGCLPAAPPPPATQCVPPLGVRYELTFGKLSVQESVNAFAGGLSDSGGGGSPTDVLGVALSDTPSVASGPTADLGSAVPATLSQAPFAVPRTIPRTRGGVGNLRGSGFKLVGKNLGEMAALTSGSAAAIGLCIWFLIGVVDSVAKGTRLKLPGL